MNADKAFFDTNVLLYMYSAAEVRKQQRARQLFDEHSQRGGILLSTQVVQEFLVACLKKLGLPRKELNRLAAEFLKLPVIVNGPEHILHALQIGDRYRISFWDALIVAAAESGGAEVLFTEDLNDGQRYGSVLARNPFRES